MEEKTQWGKDPDHGFIWNTIDHLLYWREHREMHCVSRKKNMRLCILAVKSPLAACWAGKENTLWIMSCSFCSTPTTSSPASWSGSC